MRQPTAILTRLVTIGLLAVPVTSGASAGGFADQSGDAALSRDAYGFADPAIGGAYIGAPLTRFPRPSELVPPAWGYGTYGVPTVTGIRAAPSAQPILYVIDAPTSPRGHAGRTGWRNPSRDSRARPVDSSMTSATGAGSARVISVSVPRR